MCASNTTYVSYDSTITTKEDDAAYADECATLITNISEFGNPEPLLRTIEQTSWKAILHANNMQELPIATTSINIPKMK